MENIITSQDHIDADIVAEKIAARDFEIQVSPEFEVDGEIYRVLLDGHHSLAAAIEVGADPIIVEQDTRDNDNISLLVEGNIDDFLATQQQGSNWFYVVSGRHVW